MNLTEFRIPLPITTDLFEKGQLYSSDKIKQLLQTKSSTYLQQSGLYVSASNQVGFYTHNVYQVGAWLPAWTKSIAGDRLTVEQRCWTEFPKMRTEYTCAMFDDKLRLVVDTVYHDNDNGTGHSNALELAPSLLTQRRVERLDIATSQQTLNITLSPGWIDKPISVENPIMCAYKLVACEFKYFGFQTRVQDLIIQSLKDAYMRIHAGVLNWRGEYTPLSRDSLYATELHILDLHLAPLLLTTMPDFHSMLRRSPSFTPTINIFHSSALQVLPLLRCDQEARENSSVLVSNIISKSTDTIQDTSTNISPSSDMLGYAALPPLNYRFKNDLTTANNVGPRRVITDSQIVGAHGNHLEKTKFISNPASRPRNPIHKTSSTQPTPWQRIRSKF